MEGLNVYRTYTCSNFSTRSYAVGERLKDAIRESELASQARQFLRPLKEEFRR